MKGGTMTFTQELWQSTEHVYGKILAHPFNTELAAGTLSADRFTYYAQQDELYIKAYGRSLAQIAVKAPDSEVRNDLLSYAKEGVLIEQALHDHFFKEFGVTPAGKQEPTCFSYTHFLLSVTSLQPFEIGIAALLPCFWIYQRVGHHIAQTAVKDNPYQRWIDTYSDDAYDKVVDRMVAITDSVAEKASSSVKSGMSEAFLDSTRLEWMFWDAAYRLEKWPV
jgi:thiaminase/transcriptional activator TenA